MAEDIVQTESLVELRQGAISNGDIVNMLVVTHILVTHVAGCGKELMESGVRHGNLDPVIRVSSVSDLARGTGVDTVWPSGLHSKIFSEPQGAEMVV